MDLHPGPEQRHVSKTTRAELDPIRRALQENEDWYQDLVEHSQDLLCIHDLAGRLLSVNPAPARALGYSVEELLQIPMRELVPPEFLPQFEAYLIEIERVGEARGLMAVMARSGERRIWQYYNTLRTEGVASPIVRGIAHDVTEQKRTEKLLREAGDNLRQKVSGGERTIRDLKLFRTLVDECNDAIEVVDPETLRFLDVNEKACSALGYSREELLSLAVFDIDPAVTDSSIAKIQEEWRKSGLLVVESLHRRKDGTIFPVEVSTRRVQLERDYIVAVVRDLTEHKLAEARLRASEARYRAVHDRSPVGICLIESGTGRFLGVNPKYCEIAGRTEQDLLGRDFQSITHPDDLKENCAKLRQLVVGEARHYEMEKRYIRPDGSIRWVEVAIEAMGAEGEIPVWHMAIVQDITERKHAEELQREYERVVEGLAEIILVVDRQYRYVLANRAYLQYRGLSREEVVGRSLPELMGEEIFETTIKGKMNECFEGKVVQFEKKFKFANLGERDLHVSYFPVEGSSGIDRVACVMQDITEHKQAEEAWRKSDARERVRSRELEIVLETVPVAVYIARDASCKYITTNRTGYEQLRLPRGTNISKSAMPQAQLGFRILRDGVEVPTKDLPMQRAAVTAQPEYDVPLSLVFPDGNIRHALFNAVPMLGEDGRPRGVVGTSIDVTERKRTEDALQHSEENYRMFISQSSEGIFREDMDAPVSIDLPEDQLVRHILYDSYMAECNDAMARMYGLTSGQEFVGKRLTEMLPPEDPHNIELTRDYIRSGFRILDRESHEADIHGNPKVFLNSMIGIVENGRLVRTWGIQRDVTEKVKLEEFRRKAEEALRQNLSTLQALSEELRLAKEKLSEEKLYLEHAIDTELGFGEIIGRSSTLKEVMTKVAKVAPSDASVLLLGETGTGKELVARAIHRMSKRKDNSFIKLNCAAIPSGLLESELFGHEKGAFTGAVAKKLGRLELADKGTLFLDEIGEIPLELQPKLLRVLQDQEFERLGSTQTLKVDFRLVAATNRDLLHSVSQHEFRSDLYYRLNVFPIRTPPLRDRREDIPLLIEHFVRKYAARMNKSIISIPAKTMETLVQWSWPGNIRELENFVERSVILTPGLVLQVPLGELHAEPDQNKSETLRDKERERILRALRECNGQLGGPNGAAARLGLKRTTLQSKLSQFGIKPEAYRN